MSIEGTSGTQGNVSRLFKSNGWGNWNGIKCEAYKQASETFRHMSRWELVGKRGESIGFHVRYFTIGAGGFSTFEKHQHEHAVIILHGHGCVRLGDQTHTVAPGDVIYISPSDPHQLANPDGPDPLGFLCIVDAQRDAPQPIA